MDARLERAHQALFNNDLVNAKANFMVYLAEKRRNNQPVPPDEAYAIGSLYGVLDSDLEGGFNDAEKKAALQAIRNIIAVTEPSPAPRPPLLQPQPIPGVDLPSQHNKNETALIDRVGSDHYQHLSQLEQLVLLANFTKHNANLLGLTQEQANLHSDLYMVDFVNRVVDNAGNEIGMTKLGGTTSVILQGELHGRLSAVITNGDRKNFDAGPLDVDGLTQSLSKRYDTFVLDQQADKAYNNQETQELRAVNNQYFLERMSPKPSPGGRVIDEAEQMEVGGYRTPTPFSTVPRPEGVSKDED